MAKAEPTAYEYSLHIAEESRGDVGKQGAEMAFEAWERRCHQIRSAQYVVGGFAAVVILIALVALFVEDGIPPQPARYLLIGFVALLALALTLWDVLRLFPASKVIGTVLFDDGMKPFHEVRAKLASGEEIAVRQDGSRISAPLFSSPISLTAFSQDERIRRIRLPGSLRGLEDEFLIQTNSGDKESLDIQASLMESFERLTEKIDHVEKSVNKKDFKTARKQSKKRHWYSKVTATMHKERSAKIAARWDGIRQLQVQLAFDTAYSLTREGAMPRITLVELVDRIATALNDAGYPIGLRSNESQSVEWIHKMFGNVKNHKYSDFQRYLTDPDFQLPGELPFSKG